MFLEKGVCILAALCVVSSLPIDDTHHRVRRFAFGSFGGGFGSSNGGFGSSNGGFGSYGSGFGSSLGTFGYPSGGFGSSSGGIGYPSGGFGSSSGGFGSSSLNLYPSINIPPTPSPFAIRPFGYTQTSKLGTQTLGGLSSGPFSASVAQSIDAFGKPSPQKFDLGADFKNPDTGAGIDLGISKTPSYGGSASVGGSVNLHHTDTSNLNAVGRHTEHFDKDWSSVGQSNTLGLEYKKSNDLTVGVGVTRVEPNGGKPSTDVVASLTKNF